MNQTLAGQLVAVYVTGPDGQLQARPFTASEAALATRADALLRSTAGALPGGAHWERAELNGALTERNPAYLYLRYRSPGGAALEFWAHLGQHAAFNARRGLLTLPEAPP